MENLEKNHVVFTKDRLIRKISAKTGKGFNYVRKVYDAFESSLMDMLSTADKDTDVTVKLCEGITISSEYLPEKDKLNNLTGKEIKTKEKIKCKASVTRSYCDKLLIHNK